MGILKQLETDYDLDIVEDFLTHFDFMSSSLDSLIIKLSRKEVCSENLDEIFRIFRNIKSAAEFLKLEPLIKLATLCEDILDEAKNQKDENSEASDEFIDWLLLVADQVEAYRMDIENDELYFHILNPKIINIPKRFFS
ncbi:phosphorelay protein [Campylobacter hyointestinalis]|uniref:Phosphorelay protein n=1 Tax=Campylobacter hyointestinalis TaxID=198 RepID=A0A562X8Q6_CAMHY|nr:phosphorelay protein [Campylobacter hyointestinalis]RAZ26296.1 phosphorelay protein [Campylobacter hyointestinalis subsp. lawsonii]RAZ39487.1 phosphorelay protein [Campylobacter hyointestinalis subsp. lawsonii]RAZ49261.1 phosphorelay protein [Campylobacter hyointestinalis subsp. lawsonii]RAZ60120.1 phosphorelay protein [Campylobacter hyointestinalis subsp. lawsonii]TWO18539.1 phosphorelay protein [Campylobacter hyointestinalis]